jgi:hypothetical protein
MQRELGQTDRELVQKIMLININHVLMVCIKWKLVIISFCHLFQMLHHKKWLFDDLNLT